MAPRTLGRLGRSWTASDALYAVVLVALTTLTARVWWLSAILPAMDHPQFLVFVRALQDYRDPSSPFFGTYSIGPWFMPTALPIHLTSALSTVCGHSIEAAGKLLLTMQNVGMVLGGVYLLHLLRRSRWAIVLLFPLVHSRWTVVGGYVLFATSMALVVVGWALTVRWLRRLDVASGVALAVWLCITLAWHGIGFVSLGLGVAVLWLLWRAPSPRARALSIAPTLPSLLLCAVWIGNTFTGGSGASSSPSWMPPSEAAEKMVEYVWASVPHAQALALVLAALVVGGLLLRWKDAGASKAPERPERAWRVGNPFLVVSLAYLAAYFALPMYVGHVEIISARFAYPAALAFVFAWSLPSGRAARAAVVACVLAFATFCLGDLTARFRAFDADTRGASELIDRVGPHETLYYFPRDAGASKDFAPGHKPLRELQQYATVRHGGLPNSSFAGYGVNYVRYATGHNPMPGLNRPPSYGSEMTRFDWVLTRQGDGPNDRRFQLVESRGGWELYRVCGSARFPQCG